MVTTYNYPQDYAGPTDGIGENTYQPYLSIFINPNLICGTNLFSGIKNTPGSRNT